MTQIFLHREITDKIIKAFYKVYNTLGYGFLEKIYENALRIELHKMNLACSQQFPVEVFYSEEKVGLYFADLVINDCVIIEIKAAEGLVEEHEAQLTNYLRATNIEVVYL